MRYIWTVLLLCCCKIGLYAEKEASRPFWPQSETNHYEIVGDIDLGILIPLPDYTYRESKKEHQYYEHDIYHHRSITFTVDRLVSPKTVKAHADRFTKSWEKEDPSLEIIKEKEFASGLTGSVPMVKRTWKKKNERYIIHQLFIIKNDLGFCITAACTPPEEIPDKLFEQENKYWEDLMDELARAVDPCETKPKSSLKPDK